jgi:hypothetical protein
MAFYKPQPILINLLDFKLIEKDEYGCFWDSFTKPYRIIYKLVPLCFDLT